MEEQKKSIGKSAFAELDVRLSTYLRNFLKRTIVLLSFIVLAALNSGCSTLADAQASRGKGSSKVYEKPYEVVWNAVIETVHSSGLKLVSANKEEGCILAQDPISAFSWGENVAIFVEDMGVKNRTSVEVVSKRVIVTNITATDWEPLILEALDKRL